MENERIMKVDIIALKKLMIEKEFDRISELAQASGISRATLSHILNGKAQPSSRIMEKLIITLDILPEDAGKIFFRNNLRNA